MQYILHHWYVMQIVFIISSFQLVCFFSGFCVQRVCIVQLLLHWTTKHQLLEVILWSHNKSAQINVQISQLVCRHSFVSDFKQAHHDLVSLYFVFVLSGLYLKTWIILCINVQTWKNATQIWLSATFLELHTRAGFNFKILLDTIICFVLYDLMWNLAE